MKLDLAPMFFSLHFVDASFAAQQLEPVLHIENGIQFLQAC